MKSEERLTDESRMYLACDFMEDGIAPYFNKLVEYEDTMMSPQDIVDHKKMFKAYRHACGGLSPEEIEQLKEKQIPKAPVDDPEAWLCPNCKSGVFHEQQRMHCRQCGQLIAWDLI